VTFPFVIESLSADHDRQSFSSGVEALDRYFREQVTQDIRRRVTACFVALESSSRRVAGYYTMASTSVDLIDLAPDVARKLPRYPRVPAVRLGRLAVDLAFHGRGLGAVLLWNATARAVRSEIAAFALVVDAKDENAATFYRHHGFVPFLSSPMSLYVPLAEAERRMKKMR